MDFRIAIIKNYYSKIEILYYFFPCIFQPKLFRRTLQCLENIHLSQSGKLLNLLVDSFLSTHHLIIANICDRLACKRMELLLSEPSSSQLTVQEIDKFLNSLESYGITRRYDFLGLLKDLLVFNWRFIDMLLDFSFMYILQIISSPFIRLMRNERFITKL